VLTPREAIERGADFIVVGRAVTSADDPLGAARAVTRGLT
jgi:orotidine-5'-phosphate decarboxylase